MSWAILPREQREPPQGDWSREEVALSEKPSWQEVRRAFLLTRPVGFFVNKIIIVSQRFSGIAMAKYAVLREKVRQLNEACLFQAQEEMRGFLKNISAVVTDLLALGILGAFAAVFLEAWTGDLHTLSTLVLR